MTDRPAGRVAPSEALERVREVVADIPPGRTMSYGDIGNLVGLGPRQVGSILADASSGWPWWRVTRADGTLPGTLQDEATRRYAAEGTPTVRGHADRHRSRWDPQEESAEPR